MAGEEVQLRMRLYSYVLARDYGFAPNPFFGWCTLATCKPQIRRGAAVGDWVMAIGPTKEFPAAGHIMYAMRVDEVMDFTTYWNDPRFLAKRPVLNGSLKQLYGDNIYRKQRGRWIQANSHHSHDGGRPNRHNIDNDTSRDRLLISKTFVYFGVNAPSIPKRLRPFKVSGEDLSWRGRGHRRFSEKSARALVAWLGQRGDWGLQGLPLEFGKHRPAISEQDHRATKGETQ